MPPISLLLLVALQLLAVVNHSILWCQADPQVGVVAAPPPQMVIAGGGQPMPYQSIVPVGPPAVQQMMPQVTRPQPQSNAMLPPMVMAMIPAPNQDEGEYSKKKLESNLLVRKTNELTL